MSAILRPEDVTHLVIHTIAFQGDATVEDVDRWHRERGWEGIGYHRYFRRNGWVNEGRPLNRVGAHVLGWNHCSIGYAFEGHGDYEDFTEAQKKAFLHQALFDFHRFPNLAIERVVGHREFPGVTKTCPGLKVDMDELRQMLLEYITPELGLAITVFEDD